VPRGPQRRGTPRPAPQRPHPAPPPSARPQCELPAHGSLGPLFYAFGLITLDDLRNGLGDVADAKGGQEDQRDFVEWLSGTIKDAVAQAAQHERLRQRVRETVSEMERTYSLLSLELGGEFALSTAEQVRQMESLLQFRDSMEEAVGKMGGNRAFLEGLVVRVYHPQSAPIDMSGVATVADNGSVVVVVDGDRLSDALTKVEVDRARSLCQLNKYWQRRTQELSGPVGRLLNVQNVWSDSREEGDLQRFVTWAGAILRQEPTFREKLGGQRFSYSVLVHTDSSSNMVDFLPASSVLQVRADCPPQLLLEFMTSNASAAASLRADEVLELRKEEDAVLEDARASLQAKHVIRVCTFADQEEVLSAARRLAEAAPALAATVDLTGASIAIDDCYDIWDSGFISIPYNFDAGDISNQLSRLLEGAKEERGDGGGSGGGGAPAALDAGSPPAAEAPGPAFVDPAQHLQDHVVDPGYLAGSRFPEDSPGLRPGTPGRADPRRPRYSPVAQPLPTVSSSEALEEAREDARKTVDRVRGFLDKLGTAKACGGLPLGRGSPGLAKPLRGGSWSGAADAPRRGMQPLPRVVRGPISVMRLLSQF